MFLKLLKYELRWNYKRFLMIYGVFFLLTLIVTILDRSAIATVIDNPMHTPYMLVFIFTVIELKKDISRDTKYLTFSLPIKAWRILIIKLFNYLLKQATIFISIILLSLWCVLLNHVTLYKLYNEAASIKWDLLYTNLNSILGSTMLIFIFWLVIVINKILKANDIYFWALGVIIFIFIFGISTLGFLGAIKLHIDLPAHQIGYGIIMQNQTCNLTLEMYMLICIIVLFVATANLLEYKGEF